MFIAILTHFIAALIGGCVGMWWLWVIIYETIGEYETGLLKRKIADKIHDD